jgi:hypothetical protein
MGTMQRLEVNGWSNDFQECREAADMTNVVLGIAEKGEKYKRNEVVDKAMVVLAENWGSVGLTHQIACVRWLWLAEVKLNAHFAGDVRYYETCVLGLLHRLTTSDMKAANIDIIPICLDVISRAANFHKKSFQPPSNINASLQLVLPHIPRMTERALSHLQAALVQSGHSPDHSYKAAYDANVDQALLSETFSPKRLSFLQRGVNKNKPNAKLPQALFRALDYVRYCAWRAAEHGEVEVAWVEGALVRVLTVFMRDTPDLWQQTRKTNNLHPTQLVRMTRDVREALMSTPLCTTRVPVVEEFEEFIQKKGFSV